MHSFHWGQEPSASRAILNSPRRSIQFFLVPYLPGGRDRKCHDAATSFKKRLLKRRVPGNGVAGFRMAKITQPQPLVA
jgi:hypothetical protein